MLSPVWLSGVGPGQQLHGLFLCYVEQGSSKTLGPPKHGTNTNLAYLVDSRSIKAQVYSRLATLYNNIRKGHNKKMLAVLQQSINCHKMGIIGQNTQVISREWNCGFEHLELNQKYDIAADMSARAGAIREELSECCERQSHIDGFTHEEVVNMLNFISCYRD